MESSSSPRREAAAGISGRRGDAVPVNFAFLITLLTLLCGFVGLQIWHARVEATERYEIEASNLAHALAVQVGHMMQITDLLLSDVTESADDAPGRPFPRESQLRRVQRLQALAPDFLTLMLADRTGHLEEGGGGVLPGQAVPDAARPAWFVAVRDSSSALVIGRPVTARDGRSWLLPIGRRLTGADGQFDGEAVALWSMERFGDTLDMIPTTQNGMFNLVRDDGALLFRKAGTPSPNVGSFNIPAAALRLMLAGGEGQYDQALGMDGHSRRVTFVTLPRYGLIVQVGQPLEDVLADWRRSALVLLAVLAAVLTLAGGLGRLQMRQVRRHAGDRQDLQRVAADLHASEARYRLLAENASDMIVELDLEGRRTYVSPGSRAVLGYDPHELTGVSTFNFVHPEDIAMVRARMAAVASGAGDIRATNRCIHKNGHVVWIETSLRLVRDPQTGRPKQIVSVVRDITARKLDEMRIRQLAVSDVLTGLANRRLFIEALEQALRAAAADDQCAVLFIDLDKFKPVNDLHGHSAGDAILQRVAGRLQVLAPPDAVVGRLGGDEFAVLLNGAAQAERAQALAEQIVADMTTPIQLADHRVELGASIGIAISPRDAGDAEALLRLADIAMYVAKRGGGSRACWFESSMETELAEETAIKGRLRGAIVAGEIVPYYQKLIRLKDSELVGFEVLARWHHPDDGLVMPDRFIHIAEEMGLVGTMFEALLHRVCRDAADWPQSLRIAVNVSPLQLQEPDLAARIAAILADGGLQPHRLEVEITENALIRDLPLAKQVVADLQQIGIRVALDDFGTGYASVTHLKELRFDRIKIDRSFARSAAWDAESQRYLAIIVGLGKSLGLEVTAEGIEDAPTLRQMIELGCTYGQGYLFGEAQPAGRIEMTTLTHVA